MKVQIELLSEDGSFIDACKGYSEIKQLGDVLMHIHEYYNLSHPDVVHINIDDKIQYFRKEKKGGLLFIDKFAYETLHKNFLNNIKYPLDMHEECIPLCNAINKMPGLRTTYSCSGHDDPKRSFMMFVEPECANNISPLLYILREKIKNFGVNSRWDITLDVRTDKDNLAFLLSAESQGTQAYEESKVIAHVIDGYLTPDGTNPEFDSTWNEFKKPT